VLCALLLQSAVAAAASPAYAPQPLATALEQFARATGLQLVYRTELAEGLMSKGAGAQLTAAQTLGELLRDTGLGFAFIDERTVTIFKVRSASDISATRTTGGTVEGTQKRSRLSWIEGLFGFAAGPIAPAAPGQDLAAGTAGARAAAEGYKTDELEEIVITGSLIRGVRAAGVAVTTYPAEQIQETGIANVADLLHQIGGVPRTSLDPQSQSREGSNINNIAPINLHGLDTPSTLTLLNGYRVAPSGFQFTGFDAPQIPINAIARVDVLQDGASATYGSDAVAGVVNIVLRTPFDGAESSGRIGWADGYRAEQFGQTAGKTWAAGGVFLAYQHSQRTPLRASSRSFLTDDWTRYGADNQQLVPPYVGVADPANLYVGSSANRRTYAVPTGQNGRGLTFANLTPGLNSQSTWLGTDGIGPENRNSFVGTLRQELTERVAFTADAFYNSREVVRSLRALSVNTPGASFMVVPDTNPFFVPGIPGVTASENLRYSFYQDFGPQSAPARESSFRLAGNLNFDLGAAWEGIVHAGWSRDWGVSSATNVSPSALAAALADPNPATAFNPFGSGSVNNPATLAKILGLLVRQQDYSVKDVVASADGPAVTLPAGPLRTALGVEYRRDLLTKNGIENYLTGLSDTSAYEPYYEKTEDRTVQSAYAEAFVPIVGPMSSVALLKSLSLTVAYRIDHYSDFGSTENPKFGIEWEPGLTGLKLRGTYGTSYRAPTLVEKDGIISMTTASLSLTPEAAPVNGLVLSQDGGSKLGPVKSTTYTLGVDFQPEWFSGGKVFVTYYNIAAKDYIQSPVIAPDIMYNPVDARYVVTKDTATANAILAQYFADPNQRRLVTSPIPVLGTVNFVLDDTDWNVGQLRTEGYDFGADYPWSNGTGNWDAGVSGTYVTSFRQQDYAGGPWVEKVNTNDAVPLRFVGRATLDWHKNGLHAGVAYNYQNAYLNSDYPNAGQPPYEPIDSLSTVDIALGYETGEHPTSGYLQGISVVLRVVNLFNRDPPIALTPDAIRTPIAVDTYHSDILGRTVAIAVAKRW
jgi:iron complex outermembrane receptor protein